MDFIRIDILLPNILVSQEKEIGHKFKFFLEQFLWGVLFCFYNLYFLCKDPHSEKKCLWLVCDTILEFFQVWHPLFLTGSLLGWNNFFPQVNPIVLMQLRDKNVQVLSSYIGLISYSVG